MEKKKSGILGTLLIWLVSLIVLVFIGAFVMNFLGIPVLKTMKDVGNKIPVVNKIIPDSSKHTVQSKEEDLKYWKNLYSKAEKSLQEKDQEIEDLQEQLKANQIDAEINNSNIDSQKLAEATQSQADQEQKSKVTAIFENLPASKAAAMIETMSLEEASHTLSQLDPEIQSNILGKMKDAQKAAQITMQLIK
ncbi:hypothetical protein [Neobacillus citreus]|uniref:Magnesium transporter MgtE intracellular domain-containing protein n=1 Tax=Neobacillus citreus TaxID=2833578 RepID=A0A942SUZ5_9BACI|nr:hypothetical protein [Neobacillus citreus]MCH6266818.1 hypothetical protein [Neobacillus citreus]